MERIKTGAYQSQFELMRDMALNLFWANRFAITEDRSGAGGFASLPPSWDTAAEEQILRILFDVFGSRKNHATELPAVKPTVQEVLADPTSSPFACAATTRTSRSSRTSRERFTVLPRIESLAVARGGARLHQRRHSP